MTVIRLGTFTNSLLLDVARNSGMLRGAELEVTEISVSSSPAQFASVRAGELDAVLTSPDNVLAYRFLRGNPLGELLDLEIVAALDRGLGLCLAVREGFEGAEAIRGSRFGVDVPTSGFAFVGYALLKSRGVSRNAYQTITLGSTPKRTEALLTGGCEGTVLNASNELRARAAGCTLIGSVAELGPYLGTVLARLAMGAQPEAVDRLAQVLLEVGRGIRDGSLHPQLISSAQRALGLDLTLALEHEAVLLRAESGLVLDGLVDAASLRTLVELRREFLPTAELADIPSALDQMVRSDVFVPD